MFHSIFVDGEAEHSDTPLVIMENMTPIQRNMPKAVQRQAYERLPMTCETVRTILDEAKAQLMADLEIDPADDATVDAAISYAFCRIRDEVTQPFRDEQMTLLRDTPLASVNNNGENNG